MLRKPLTIKQKIAAKIDKAGGDVFLTSEFADIAGYDQVLRVLRQLVVEGKMVKLGLGVYARAEPNPINGQPMLAAPGGLMGAARQALTKLGANWDETQEVYDYNAGRSTQIPANAVFRIRGGRLPRKLSYRGKEVVYEQQQA